MSNSLDPDQDRQNVGPDLGPNCLQRLSADDKSCEEREDKFSIINSNRTLWGYINSLQTIFFYVIVFWSITNGSAGNP